MLTANDYASDDEPDLQQYNIVLDFTGHGNHERVLVAAARAAFERMKTAGLRARLMSDLQIHLDETPP